MMVYRHWGWVSNFGCLKKEWELAQMTGLILSFNHKSNKEMRAVGEGKERKRKGESFMEFFSLAAGIVEGLKSGLP